MTTRILLLAFVLVAATGCTAVDKNWMPKAPWDKKSALTESQYDSPVRMAAIWTPDVMIRPGMPASRGFGGRLYFYNQLNKPVQVEGQLVVYAYDDTAEESERESPDRKYAFTPEQFTRHRSESELGQSYSIWLPWDTDASGEQKSISLVPVFTATSGKIVMGQQAVNLLQGKKSKRPKDAPPEATLSQRAATGVRPAGFQGPPGTNESAASSSRGEQSRRGSIQTTTINLPRTMQQRVIEAAQNRASRAPLGDPDPVLVEKARATLERLRTNSTVPAGAVAPRLPSQSTRFAPPRPRVPSSPAAQSAFSRGPSRPLQRLQRFGPPSSQPPTAPTANSEYGTAFGQIAR